MARVRRQLPAAPRRRRRVATARLTSAAGRVGGRGHAWAGDAPDSACGRLLHRLSGDAGFVPEVRYLTADLEVSSQLVAAGVAVAVLPRLAMTRMPDDVTVHPLPGLERRVVALTRTASTERPAVALVVAELERAGETAAAYRVRP